MKAIILVAGYATRLYPYTEKKAKALLEVNKKPIINFIVDKINKVDIIDEIFVVSNHKFYEDFKEWAEVLNNSKKITVLDDGTETEETRRGAIGDIQFVIETANVNDEIMVIAGDNLFTYELQDYIKFYSNVEKDCVVAKKLGSKDELKQFAVATLDENGKILELCEKPEEPKSNIAVYANYIYTKETVKLFHKYLEEGNNKDAPGYFVQWLYKRKDVYAYIFKGDCLDIGNPKAYEDVQSNPLFSE